MQLNEQVAQLKSRLGPEGTKVKLGFTIYIGLKMNSWTVDPTNRAGLRAGLLAGTAFPLAIVVTVLGARIRSRARPA